MVRATYALVLVRLGGVLPTGWTESGGTLQISDLCTQADYIIDNYTKPVVMSTTANTAKEVAVEVVLRMMKQAEVARRSSGALSSEGFVYPADVIILTDRIKDMIDRELSENYSGMRVFDQI